MLLVSAVQKCESAISIYIPSWVSFPLPPPCHPSRLSQSPELTDFLNTSLPTYIRYSSHHEHRCVLPRRTKVMTSQRHSLSSYGHREIRHEHKFRTIFWTKTLKATQRKREASFKCCQRAFDTILVTISSDLKFWFIRATISLFFSSNNTTIDTNCMKARLI